MSTDTPPTGLTPNAGRLVQRTPAESRLFTLRAEVYRHGVHDLMPYWSPDLDGDVDPLADPEIRQNIRAFVAKVLELTADEKARTGDSPASLVVAPAVLDAERDIRWYLHTGCRIPLQLPSDRRPAWCPNCDDRGVPAESWLPLYLQEAR